MTSEQILQAFLQNQQSQSRWNSPQNLLNLATLGLSGIGGLAQGAQQGKQNALSREAQIYQQMQDAYERRRAARSGLGGAIMGNLDRRDAAGVNIANASPLGAEQLFRQKMARSAGMSDVAANFSPLRPGAASTVGGFVAQNPNILGAITNQRYRDTVSEGATEGSIRDRRTVIDGLRADTPDKLHYENQLMALLTRQMEEASKPLYNENAFLSGSPQDGAQAPAKKPGFWSKLGKVALPIAGLAAGFIPGVGPLAGMALAGAGGAAGGALGGGGVRGAIMGGASGAAAGYGMAKTGIGEPAARTFNNRMTPASLPAGMWGANPQPLQLPNSMNPLQLLTGTPPPLPQSQVQQAILPRPGGGGSVPRPAAPVVAPPAVAPPAAQPAPQWLGYADQMWNRHTARRGDIHLPSGPQVAPAPTGPYINPKVAGTGPLFPDPSMRHPQAGGFNIQSILGGQPLDVVMVKPGERAVRVPAAQVQQYMAKGYMPSRP